MRIKCSANDKGIKSIDGYAVQSILNRMRSRKDGYVPAYSLTRYKEFCDKLEDENNKDVTFRTGAEFLKELIELCETNADEAPGRLLNNVILFSMKYTSHDNDVEAQGALKSVVNRMIQMDETSSQVRVTHEDVLNILLSLLDGLSITDHATEDSVKVSKLDDWDIIDRNQVFIVGMSSDGISAGSRRSLLSEVETDELIEKNVEGHAIYTGSEEERYGTRIKEVNNSLATADQEAELYLSYTCFDTAEIIAKNPSQLYIDYILADRSGDIIDIINSIPEACYSDDYASDIKEEEYESKCDYELIECTDDELYDVFETQGISASTLEQFISCPLMFALKKLRHINRFEFNEMTNDREPDAKSVGTLIHKYMELYGFNNTTESELYEKLNDCLPYIHGTCPVTSPVQILSAIERRMLILNHRLDIGFSEHKSKGWKPLFEEYELDGTVIEDFPAKGHKTLARGNIDLIEYRIDNDEKGGTKAFIRLVDYKTGKYNYDDEKRKRGTLVQQYFYRIAITQNNNREKITEKIKEIEGISNLPVAFDKIGFIYEYLCDIFHRKDKVIYTIDCPPVNPLKAYWSCKKRDPFYKCGERLAKTLELISDNGRFIDFFDYLDSLQGKGEKAEITNRACGFCDYKDACTANSLFQLSEAENEK